MMPPVAVADGVARIAARRSAQDSISRRGPVVRARRMVAAGVSTESAAEAMAKVAKGYVAEAQLAASVSARSGLVGSNVGAYPNRNAFDPTDDIILTQAGIRSGAVQVKNGQRDYILKQVESGKYPSIVANRDAVEGLERIGGLAKGQVSSCIDHAGVRSVEFSSVETHQEAKDLLVSALQESSHSEHVMALACAVKSGTADGVVNFGLSLVSQAVEDRLSGRPSEFLPMVGEAVKAGAKAVLRTTVVTYSQSITLLRRAKGAFSARLIRAITSSTLVMSAIADVVVDFAFDVVDVLRGKIDEETLFRNLGVNSCGALGGLAGAGLALLATRDAPWWLKLLLVGVGLWLGAVYGRRLGKHLFRDEEATLPEVLPVP